MMKREERLKMALGELMLTQIMMGDRIDQLTEENAALKAQAEKPPATAAEAPAGTTTAAPGPGDA